MISLEEQLNTYRSYHQDSRNQRCHEFGIPMVLLGTLILLSWLHLNIAGKWQINLAWLTVIATLIYYFCLERKIAFPMTIIMLPITAIMSWLATPQPTWFSTLLFIILFGGGWFLQLLGHSFEGKRPAFTKNTIQLLIAPIYLLLEYQQKLKVRIKPQAPKF